MKHLFIGTSGYNYSHWKEGVFYPPGLKEKDFFKFYQKVFNSVELNVTFYRLPSKKVFESWFKNSDEDFCFVIKGPRLITHLKRLKNCSDSLQIFLDNCSALKYKLKCVLWQFPASFKENASLLKEFIKDLLKHRFFKKIDHSFEFRHPSWFKEDVYKILRDNNLNLCIAHSKQWPCKEVITSHFLYLRFHGGQILYGSNYSIKELKEWAKKTLYWIDKHKIKYVYAFFNNDAYGFAPKNALKFKELLENAQG